MQASISSLVGRRMTDQCQIRKAPTLLFKLLHAMFLIFLTQKKFKANLHQQLFFAEYVEKK